MQGAPFLKETEKNCIKKSVISRVKILHHALEILHTPRIGRDDLAGME
jgi:hypothetical protein